MLVANSVKQKVPLVELYDVELSGIVAFDKNSVWLFFKQTTSRAKGYSPKMEETVWLSIPILAKSEEQPCTTALAVWLMRVELQGEL